MRWLVELKYFRASDDVTISVMFGNIQKKKYKKERCKAAMFRTLKRLNMLILFYIFAQMHY